MIRSNGRHFMQSCSNCCLAEIYARSTVRGRSGRNGPRGMSPTLSDPFRPERATERAAGHSAALQLRGAAEAYVRGEDTSRFATVRKLESARLAREVSATCLQFHGCIGYLEETLTARYFRGSPICSIGGESEEAMLYVLSRLDGYHA